MRKPPTDSENLQASDSSDPSSRGEDRPASELDDRADREELRERYYGLLQELRVILPGVQVLVAFLLTVPFASRSESWMISAEHLSQWPCSRA